MKTILVADSCAGGLGVFEHVEKWAANYNLIYLADYKENPFGLKTKEEITQIVKSWLFHFKKKPFDISVLIIACNTASIASFEHLPELSEKYKIPIVSMVEGMDSCLMANVEKIKNKNVAIMVTKYLISSGKYFSLIEKYSPRKIVNIIGTKTEHVVATGRYKDQLGKKEIRDELIPYSKEKIDTLILGCTCFCFIEAQIKEVLGEQIICLDPAKMVSEIARKKLDVKTFQKSEKVTVFTTGNLEESQKSINLLSKPILNREFKVNYFESI